MSKKQILVPILVLIVLAAAASIYYFKPYQAWWPSSGPVLQNVVDRGLEPADREKLENRIAEARTQAEIPTENGSLDLAKWLELGNLYYQIGDLQAASAAYDRILAQSPKDAPALENKGQARLEMGDYAGAEDLWRQSLLVNPYEVTYLRLANLISQNYPDRRDDARQVLEDGIASLGQQSSFLVALGNWYRAGGDLETALSHYEVAKQLDPGNTGLDAVINEMRLEQIKAFKEANP